MRACENLSCCVSTGIHDGLTFGYGTLDDNGYWQYPCAPCARENEKNNPQDFPCWPFDWDGAKKDCYIWDKLAAVLGKEYMKNPRPMGPSREGSSRCQSFSIASGGHREYCTCDTCF